MSRTQLVILFFCCIACTRSSVASNNDSDKEIQYKISTDIFPNPERGFIHNIESHSESDPLSAGALASLRSENVSMILRLYYLEKFKAQAISDVELSLIRSDFQLMRDAGIKCVLRFAYTDDMSKPDAPFSIISQHLDQLKPLLEDNKDIIAFVQAGLIGAWGEWHSSSNGLATTENEKKVIDKWLSVLPPAIMVQVRTPAQKQQIFGTTDPVSEANGYSSDKIARIGHHNDCFMASVDDYGTYGNVQADKEYISKEGLFVPTGGETCPPDPPSSAADCPTATSTMKLLRWTYLNLDWYKPVIDAWKVAGCFDELQRNLGYRLALESASIPDKVEKTRDLKITINITNLGYAPLYNYKNAVFVLKNTSSGELHEIALDDDLRKCKPMVKFKIEKTINTTDLPAGGYDLYLKICDDAVNLKSRSEYSIRLANENTWVQDNGGMNNLNHLLLITE
ncbi:MAG: DUF4832 domain-containing protein [Flavitalea sp.]